MWSKGRGSFDTKVYICLIYTEVFNYGLALIRLYMHIYMYMWDIFTFGYFDTELYMGIYMELFSIQPRAQIFISVFI